MTSPADTSAALDIQTVAQEMIGKASSGEDAARRLLGLPGWEIPKTTLAHFEIAGGNLLIWENVKPEVKINGKGNLVVFGAVMRGSLKGAIKGNHNVLLIGGQADQIRLTTHVAGDGGLIYVGERTKVIGAHFVLGATNPPSSLLIGERSMLSSQVSLRATDSHGIVDLAAEKVINLPQSIIIEPHVWIGESASILKGSRVGAGSIVGAGALVASSLPSRVVCAGIPAKVIQTGVSWTNRQHPSATDIQEMKRFLDTVDPTHSVHRAEDAS